MTELSTAIDATPIRIGNFTLTDTGMHIEGKPSLADYQGIGEFIQKTHKASGFWLADWIAYGESRRDWRDRLEALMGPDIVTEQTVRQYRYVATAVPAARRVGGVSFGHHAIVASLKADEQTHWLTVAKTNGWTQSELRKELRASQRRTMLRGQAELNGVFRVVYADPPWQINESSKADVVPGKTTRSPMTVADLCKLPVAAHTQTDSVLFLWVPAPMLMLNPGPREVIEAWGFTYKTGIVWDRVLGGAGNYFDVTHEHLLVCTRGSCLPDHPTPQPKSIVVERRGFANTEKPESVRRLIVRLYDGPYLELFGRCEVADWQVFGADAALWHLEVSS